jgi:hypothetical protein
MDAADSSLVVPCPHCAALNRVPRDKLGQAPACGRCHQSLFTGKPLALDEAGFDRHVGAGGCRCWSISGRRGAGPAAAWRRISRRPPRSWNRSCAWRRWTPTPSRTWARATASAASPR